MAQSQVAQDTDAAKGQVLEIFRIFRAREWKTLYDLIECPPAVMKNLGTKEAFARDFETGMKQTDPQDNFGKLMKGMTDISVGIVLIEGDFAYVPTSCTLDINGNKIKMSGLAKLKKADGKWKWDLTQTDNVENAAGDRTAQLLGEPIKTPD